ncbi:MAG: GAF domain-containing protein, partial [Anaerolineales bacterium]|nr:GAF domain-containing protein [Anaerolineales bacterium]
ISSTALRPQASLSIWVLAAGLMVVATAVSGNYSALNLITLLPPIGFGLVVALGSMAAAMDWEIAVTSASEAQIKAQRRRDELFAIQGELKKANAKSAFLYTQLTTSTAVGQRVVSLLDMNELLTQVAVLIKRQLNFGYIGIFLLDDKREQLEVSTQAGHEFTANENKTIVRLGMPGSISLAANSRQPVVIDNLANLTDHERHPFVLPNMLSEISLPLYIGGELLGVMNIQSRNSNAFGEDNLGMLRSLADQVAIAINNAHLYRQQEIRYQLTTTLNEIGRALSSTLNLEEVLDLILENMATLIDYNRAAVFMHRRSALELMSSRGFPATAQDLRIPITDDEDVFLHIYHTKQPLAIPDVTLYPGWKQFETLPNARTWLGIPLLREDEVVGMLSLAREAAEPYTQDEIDLTVAFANQAAVALQNARLYNRVNRFNQQLEFEVQQRTQALTEAYDQLEKLDRTKSDFISVASHELRTPITVLRGYSDMLRHDGTIQANDYHRQLVEGIYSGSVRMHEIVNDMLDVVKIDSRELNLYAEPIGLNDVIQQVNFKMGTAVAERNLTLHTAGLDTLPPIEADPDALKKVFRHLLLNAIKYTPDGGQISVVGRVIPAEENDERLPANTAGVHITVSDTGIGIDPKFHDLIFTKFYQTGEVALHSSGKSKFKGGGPGLGLAIARGIVLAHQGHIWVESAGYNEQTCPGSQFHIILPLEQPTQNEPSPATA